MEIDPKISIRRVHAIHNFHDFNGARPRGQTGEILRSKTLRHVCIRTFVPFCGVYCAVQRWN